jgi:hypothetical protein
MDKNLARQLAPLISSDVQGAFEKLLEHRKNILISKMIHADNERDVFVCQGGLQELIWLSKMREYIIDKAE